MYQVPFLKSWYDPIWGWTPVSLTIGKHSTHQTNVSVQNKQILTLYIFMNIYFWLHVCWNSAIECNEIQYDCSLRNNQILVSFV